MQFTATRAALAAALGRAARIVEKTITIPILSHVLLDAAPTGLTLTGTDLELAVTIAVEAHVREPGRLAVPGRLLHDIVRRLPDSAEIAIALDPATRTLALRAGRSRFNLPTLPAEDYPALTAPPADASFSIDAGELVRLIEQTEDAVETDGTRHYLAGVYLHPATNDAGEAVLRAVATNGHLLARSEIARPEGASALPGVIVPTKACRELKSLAADHKGALRLSASLSKLEAAAGDTVLSTKLVDGTFPDYARVVPASGDKVATVDAADFAAAIGRVAILAAGDKGNHRPVKLSLGGADSLAGGALTLSTHNADSGSAEETIAVDYAGPPLEIGFSSRYLETVLGNCRSDTVRLELTDANSAALIRSRVDASDLYVVMPRRV